jgi:hypothetical protein
MATGYPRIVQIAQDYEATMLVTTLAMLRAA